MFPPLQGFRGLRPAKIAYWPGDGQYTLGALRLWEQGTEALEAGNGGSGARVGDTSSGADSEDTGSGAEADDTGSEAGRRRLWGGR